MPLCPHLTITLNYTIYLISNYDVNCDFRFREVQLGSHIYSIFTVSAKKKQIRDILSVTLVRTN